MLHIFFITDEAHDEEVIAPSSKSLVESALDRDDGQDELGEDQQPLYDEPATTDDLHGELIIYFGILLLFIASTAKDLTFKINLSVCVCSM